VLVGPRWRLCAQQERGTRKEPGRRGHQRIACAQPCAPHADPGHLHWTDAAPGPSVPLRALQSWWAWLYAQRSLGVACATCVRNACLGAWCTRIDSCCALRRVKPHHAIFGLKHGYFENADHYQKVSTALEAQPETSPNPKPQTLNQHHAHGRSGSPLRSLSVCRRTRLRLGLPASPYSRASTQPKPKILDDIYTIYSRASTQQRTT
jgi:hypothetical protein